MNGCRRRFLLAAAAVAARPGRVAAQRTARIIVVGGGFGGATCARYLKLWAPNLDVTLVEPQPAYTACPMSNRVLGGTFNLSDLTRDYTALSGSYGVRVVRAQVTDIDARGHTVRLDSGASLPWDRLVLAPGVAFRDETIAGLAQALNSGTVLHAWQGGSKQIWTLRDRIERMRQGGVVALSIPKAPYRCPPGPYERAGLIAHFLKRNNPKAKILVFDANADIIAKRDLFQGFWKQHYAGTLEYVPNAELLAVDGAKGLLRFKDQGEVRADVLNVIPPNSAPALAQRAGLVPLGDRWCPVDFRSYESKLVPAIHIVGDAMASAPGLPKSGHMANQAGKVCAAAIVAQLRGEPVPDQPVIANTCYSFVGAQEAMHVAAVYRFDAAKGTMVPVKETVGTSSGPSVMEGVSAIGWVHNILYDTFGAKLALAI